MHPFTQAYVTGVRECSGVYWLMDSRQQTIYIGQSTTSVRARLQSHLSGYEGSGTQQASYFR